MQLTKAEYRKKNDNESLKIYIFNHFQGHFKNKNVLIYKNKIAVHVSHNMLSGGGVGMQIHVAELPTLCLDVSSLDGKSILRKFWRTWHDSGCSQDSSYGVLPFRLTTFLPVKYR